MIQADCTRGTRGGTAEILSLGNNPTTGQTRRDLVSLALRCRTLCVADGRLFDRGVLSLVTSRVLGIYRHFRAARRKYIPGRHTVAIDERYRAREISLLLSRVAFVEGIIISAVPRR